MSLRILLILILLCGALALGLKSLRVNASTKQQDKAVEEVQKNIQVLKGLPSSQLLPVMHLMRTSLGVRCDYCHVAENGKYWMDDKPAKQTARKMLQMVFEINRANFGGQTIVTCNTCHRGSTKSVSVPAIGQGAFTNTIRDEEKTIPELPSAKQIFDSYTLALGGASAIDKIRTRTTKMILLRAKTVDAGTAKAAVLNRAERVTIDTFQKAPDKYLAVINGLGGPIYQGFNGTTGWTKSAQGQRLMNSVEVARIKDQADLRSQIELKDRYSKIDLIGKDRIGQQDVYVLEGRSVAGKTERLYFDAKSGFLLRRTVFTETKLGLNPEQTDYEDYRKIDGLWLPFTVRTSYLDDNHFGATRILTEIKHNVQIDDRKFEIPVSQP